MPEKDSENISRRGFVKGVTAGAVTIAAVSNAASRAQPADAQPEKKGDGKIRLAAVSWNFRAIAAGPPWTEPIDILADLGFEGVEPICAQPEQLDAVLAEPHYSNLMRQLERRKMALPQFVLFQSAVAELGDLDSEKRKRALDVFARGCQVAAKVGAPIVNIVAPWPTAYRKQGYDYLPRYYSTGTTMPGPKFWFDVPAGFEWDRAWSGFVEAMKAATQAAAAEGVRFSLENHTHTFVQGPDAFLSLWREVRDPALGMNIDIGWIQSQREYPVVAIHKVREHLMHLHLRDIDGFAFRFVPPGAGCMDFAGVVLALRRIGYSGFLSFEQDGVPDQRYALRRGREILEELLAMSPSELEKAQQQS